MNLSLSLKLSTIKLNSSLVVVRTIEPFLPKIRMDEDGAERREGWEVSSFFTTDTKHIKPKIPIFCFFAVTF